MIENKNEIIEKYMRIAIEEAIVAKEKGENPFGAVLLNPNYEFCHKAHSKSIELSDPRSSCYTRILSKTKISLFIRLHFDLFW